MMKKSKVTIALLLAGLMLLCTAGMAFASEDEDAAALAEQGIVVEAAEGEEVPEGGEAEEQLNRLEIYSWYICTAPEWLNIRTSKVTTSTDNIRGMISANAQIKAYVIGDGWAKVNFCGNTYYVASSYLTLAPN